MIKYRIQEPNRQPDLVAYTKRKNTEVKFWFDLTKNYTCFVYKYCAEGWTDGVSEGRALRTGGLGFRHDPDDQFSPWDSDEDSMDEIPSRVIEDAYAQLVLEIELALVGRPE